jgi:glyceraldehyde-3-phosphate dehydrogenase (NADP+)
VHKEIIAEFKKRFAAKVGALEFGDPWNEGLKPTPQPETDKPAYIKG